jgi:type I restriction enzyme, R subunit
MLLTGFDAPPVHTLYMDRPMQGANLMQALARVNRRFRGKQDGLLAGYAPLTENLKKDLIEYTPSDRQDQTLGSGRRPHHHRGPQRAQHHLRSARRYRLAGTARRHLPPQSRRRALRLVANHLRDPRTAGNQVESGTKTLATRFRGSTTRLERFHRVCAMSREIAERFDDLAS